MKGYDKNVGERYARADLQGRRAIVDGKVGAVGTLVLSVSGDADWGLNFLSVVAVMCLVARDVYNLAMSEASVPAGS